MIAAVKRAISGKIRKMVRPLVRNEMEQIFKNVAGDTLIALGYEKGFDW